jgi:hypothetical protein
VSVRTDRQTIDRQFVMLYFFFPPQKDNCHSIPASKCSCFAGYQSFQSFRVERTFVQVNETTLASSALFTRALTATCCTVGTEIMKLSRYFDRQQHATKTWNCNLSLPVFTQSQGLRHALCWQDKFEQVSVCL